MERNRLAGISSLAQLRAFRMKVDGKISSMEKSCWKTMLLGLIRSLRIRMM